MNWLNLNQPLNVKLLFPFSGEKKKLRLKYEQNKEKEPTRIKQKKKPESSPRSYFSFYFPSRLFDFYRSQRTFEKQKPSQDPYSCSACTVKGASINPSQLYFTPRRTIPPSGTNLNCVWQKSLCSVNNLDEPRKTHKKNGTYTLGTNSNLIFSRLGSSANVARAILYEVS